VIMALFRLNDVFRSVLYVVCVRLRVSVCVFVSMCACERERDGIQ